ncbi:hypothetical protein [Clostridium saccharoperbutylacetonicum]|uniref:hypothetical protein n=1 Tax=Clostridium saccharoperbutylacetonicum TaxID=36745 RepID=UPI001D355080|nr:hypothetical protein [Clostridium saccharoperbutylacetonicum]
MASYEQLSKDNWKVTVSLGFDSNGKRLKQKKQGFKRKKMLKSGSLICWQKNIKGMLLQLKVM